MTASDLQWLTPEWPGHTRVRAACTLRTGGVSPPPYESLNLGASTGDSPEAVQENRRRLAQALKLPSEPVWVHQVHGTAVLDASAVDLAAAGGAEAVDLGAGGSGLPVADASVATAASRVCVVRVADCMPVLFAAEDGSRVGAAHAGWRGLAAGVLEATLSAMGTTPSAVMAWMGPCISQNYFEVGDDVHQAFTRKDAEAASAFTRNERGRWQCDLYSLARRRLQRMGVRQVFGGGWCTYADRSRFFSYRRDGQCGRMAALIWMED
jgi:polyphenol oxidase